MTSKTPDRLSRASTAKPAPKPNMAVAAEMRSLRAQLFQAGTRADTAERALEGCIEDRELLQVGSLLVGDLIDYMRDPSDKDILALLARAQAFTKAVKT